MAADKDAGNLTRGHRIHRRDVLLAAGTTLTIGLDSATLSAQSASGSSGTKIDAHTHFAPPKFIEFAERVEGHSFGLSPLYKALPALTGVRPRIDLLDKNGIDMNVLVPVPWIEAFPKIYADPALAAQAAKLMNDELASVVAAYPTRRDLAGGGPRLDGFRIASRRHRARVRWRLCRGQSNR